MSSLEACLKSHPQGPIEHFSEVEPLLAAEWNSLSCHSDDHKTSPEKLYGRMEEVSWNPPFLRFKLERHGGTVNGSTRAELHYWVVNVEERTCGIERIGKRQLHPMSERVYVKPVAEEIAAIILRNGDDPRIKWTPTRDKVTIKLSQMLGGEFEQTRAGRRKRFQAVIEPILTAKG